MYALGQCWCYVETLCSLFGATHYRGRVAVLIALQLGTALAAQPKEKRLDEDIQMTLIGKVGKLADS